MPLHGKRLEAGTFIRPVSRSGAVVPVSAAQRRRPTRHPKGWTGILQADANGGYNGVCNATRKPAPARRALCRSHARRKFFDLADVRTTARKGRSVAEEISPVALDAVKRVDAIFDVERAITGLPDMPVSRRPDRLPRNWRAQLMAQAA
jgi:hypothetical protein